VRPRATTSRKPGEKAGSTPAPATPAGSSIGEPPASRRKRVPDVGSLLGAGDESTGGAGAELAAAVTPVAVPERVSIVQGGADQVTATNVDVDRGGIGRAQATDIAVSRGGVGFARGDRVSVELGGIGAAFGSEVRITQGGAMSVVAREEHLEQAFVRTVIANEVHAARTTGVLFMLARRVDGDVRTIVDWRGALAFGLAFGLVGALLRRRR
jgi:hypothetical protein